MKPTDFVHLHNHTEYSLLDGMIKISDDKGRPSEFLKNLAAQGGGAMAITDHGNMYGALDFYFSAKAVDILPIIGCEVYVAKGSRKEHNDRKENGHMTLLASDFEGYQNLMSIVSDAYTDGFDAKPRTDSEMLAKYAKGIIALSGCIQSHTAKAAAAGNIKRATELATQYRDMFGAENFYLELMDHQIPEETAAMKGLLEVSHLTGIPVVATNDCHYYKKDDWQVHEVHLCISTGSTLDDPKRFKMSTHELYFKSPEEMKQLFSHTPEAISNTVRIAERCHVEVPYGKSILPHFDIPKEFGPISTEDYLRMLCLEGIKKKMGEQIPRQYMDRLDFELSVINQMGFPSYFLIVRDFINYSRTHGIPVGPGRGSGAGSLVAYSLDITRVDPLKNGLLFERFLNPDRVSMPDLDIDFSDEGRARAIEYVRNKYGAANVAQIITFGTIKAKLAVKDVARVLGFPPSESNRLTKLIPNSLDATIPNSLATVPELQEAIKDPAIKRLFDYAEKLEGLKRHTGVHAAGILVTRERVSKYTPLAKGSRDVLTTQYEGNTLVKLGLLKIDFLGLRTLTVIDTAVELIKKLRGVDLDIQKIPLDDPKSYELLVAGRTTGVFQLESRGMKELVRALKPNQFSDISALVALYRPGPMQSGMHTMFVDRKHGRQKITYDHPLLEPILKETYGTMIYQEQVMEASKSLAGFTPGKADSLRKAMGKKNVEAMQKAREDFMNGCKKKNISEKLAKKIFDQMAEFAGYGFNKSHSVAYALVAYQTAYLKANYPTEFMTAALTSEIGHNAIGSDDKENKIVTYLNESRDMGIEVRGPDIQHSESPFSVEDLDKGMGSIRFGLTAVKNVGTEAARSIVQARVDGGPFKSLADLCSRIDQRQANKKTLESLVKAGALDCFKPDADSPEEARSQLLAELETAMSAAAELKDQRESGQGSLFGMDEQITAAPQTVNGEEIKPLTERDMLNAEKEVLGFYLSGHPLARYQTHLKMTDSVPIEDIACGKMTGTVRTAGLIVQLKKRQTKKKETWAQFTLEDMTDSISVNVFPKNFARLGGNIQPNTIVIISGKINCEEEGSEPEIFADDVTPLSSALSRYARNVTLLFSTALEEKKLRALSGLLDASKGSTPLYLKLTAPDKRTALVETGRCVETSQDFLDSVEKILGPQSWMVETAKS